MSEVDPGDLWPDVQPEAARRLLVAAVDSFARLGYHAATTRDIARTAGMSPAALYIHYPSKSALLFEISRTGHEATMALVEQAVAAGADPVSRVRALVAEFTAWHARTHTVARIVQYELHALPPEEFEVVAGLRRRIEDTVREVIADGVAQGVFQVSDVRTAARALISLGVDVARWYNERSGTAPEELGLRYAELVLGMLRAGTGPCPAGDTDLS